MRFLPWWKLLLSCVPTWTVWAAALGIWEIESGPSRSTAAPCSLLLWQNGENPGRSTCWIYCSSSPLPFFDICPCQGWPAPFTGNWPQGDCLSLGNCICFLHLSPTHTHLFACQSVFPLGGILSLRTAFFCLPSSSGHAAFPAWVLSLSFPRSFPKQWVETGSHLQSLFPSLSLQSTGAFYTVTLK